MTLPPSFPLENGGDQKRESPEQLVRRRLLEALGEYSPQEGFSESIAIKERGFSVLWRPNNYRRKIKMLIAPDRTAILTGGVLLSDGRVLEAREGRRNKLLFLDYDKNITVQIGTRWLVAAWSQSRNERGEKLVHHVQGGSFQALEGFISGRAREIQDDLDLALKRVSVALKADFEESSIVWERFEDWIKGEEYIDRLPRDLILHDTVFKKVYGEGVEFIKESGNPDDYPGLKVKNYIKNRAREDLIPKFENVTQVYIQALEGLFQGLEERAFKPFESQIRQHLKVQEETLGLFHKQSSVLDKMSDALGGIKGELQGLRDRGEDRQTPERRARARSLLTAWGW